MVQECPLLRSSAEIQVSQLLGLLNVLCLEVKKWCWFINDWFVISTNVPIEQVHFLYMLLMVVVQKLKKYQNYVGNWLLLKMSSVIIICFNLKSAGYRPKQNKHFNFRMVYIMQVSYNLDLIILWVRFNWSNGFRILILCKNKNCQMLYY